MVNIEDCPITHIYKYDNPIGLGDPPALLLADETITVADTPGSS